MKLSELGILGIWQALGGEVLQGKRARAFWRDGVGYNIALNPTEGTWYDHRDGRGGGVLALVETALGCNRRAALQWLEANCGLDPFQPLSVGDRQNFRQEREDAEHFGIAAKALAEEILDQLDACDAARAYYTTLLGVTRSGGAVLTGEYRSWLCSHPELARALVQAGASSRARS